MKLIKFLFENKSKFYSTETKNRDIGETIIPNSLRIKFWVTLQIHVNICLLCVDFITFFLKAICSRFVLVLRKLMKTNILRERKEWK